MKKYIIIAGVNGAGKSTLYQTLSTFNEMPRVNTDEIVRKIGDWRNLKDVMYAGKIAVKKIKENFEKGVTFNQETTLCGNSILNNIEKAKELGYFIELHFVGVSSVEIAKQRIAYRVAHGGHGIPDKDVERRYIESLDHLEKVLVKCDLVALYDNSQYFRRFAIYKRGNLIVLSKNIPTWYKQRFQ